MRVGLIGCGLAANQHLIATRSYKDAEVVGIADLDEEKLTSFSKKHGIDARFKYYEEMIKRVKPTVVHILTPPPTHAKIANDVLALGCGVLVEKPMCMDENEADSMIEAATANDKPLSVMHNHLFDPPILKADELLHSIPGNDPYLVHITYFVERRKMEHEGNLDLNHWIHQLPLGIYGEHGAPHVLYLLLKWLKRATDITVNETRVSAHKEGFTRLWNVTVSSSDCMGVMTLGDNTNIGQFAVEIFTPLMVIKLNMLDLTWSIYRERSIGLTAGRMLASVEESGRRLLSTTRNILAIASGRLKRRPGHRGLITAFYDSIQAGHSPPVTPGEGREVVRVLNWIENKLQDEHENKQAPLIREASH